MTCSGDLKIGKLYKCKLQPIISKDGLWLYLGPNDYNDSFLFLSPEGKIIHFRYTHLFYIEEA